MAAFGFFRRRQKMVFWIMVGLMLIFLLGGLGTSQFWQRNPRHLREGHSLWREGPRQ